MKGPLQKFIFLLAIIFTGTQSQAFTVTELAATYKSGQVFLTWKNPTAIHLKYKVYRSATAIDETADLSNATYLGYVKDRSTENIRKSELKDETHYFTIDLSADPLSESTGLYVTTCIDDKQWYYAVIVQKLSNDSEDQSIIPGENSLAVAIQENIEAPQPILQATYQDNDVTAYEYVIWGNNTASSLMPAFNNCGSYGYNFTFFSRGASPLPLYIYFRNADPFAAIDNDYSVGRNVLLLDDWMPNGKSTDWFGYHEDYDIYKVHNDVHTNGVIKAFTQTRLKYTLDWILAHEPIDAEHVYASGSSHNGLGAALTAQLYPEDFAAVWVSVAPILAKAVNGTDWEELWCDASKNLLTDVINPKTGEAFRIFDLLDLRHMYNFNYDSGIPYTAGVHGKQDFTVGWVEQMHWYDSVNYALQGGVWYWDQREHNGSGRQFEEDEIKIDFSRFGAHRSYPAFANCSINQDPGNGNRNSGDPYGAINGFLDWDDNSVLDEHCRYRIRCFIRDMTVEGVLQPQYDSCFADVSVRRAQIFKPADGDKIRWWVVNVAGKVLQDGYYIYDGVSPLLITGAKILRSGSYIIFKIKDCEDEGEQRAEGPSLEEGDDDGIAALTQNLYLTPANQIGTSNKTAEQLTQQIEAITSGKVEETEYPSVHFYRSGSGYVVATTLDKMTDVLVQMTDMTGRMIIFKRVHMVDGQNEFNLDAYRGNYLLTLYAPEFTYKKKISF